MQWKSVGVLQAVGGLTLCGSGELLPAAETSGAPSLDSSLLRPVNWKQTNRTNDIGI